MSLKIIKVFKIVLLGIILALLAVTVWSLFNRSRSLTISPSNPAGKSSSANGLEVSKIRGDTKIYRVSIESFSLEKAKLGPFTIGPLNVAHLNQVVVDLYTEGFLSDADSGENPPKLKKFGIDSMEDLIADLNNNSVFRSKKTKIINIKDISLNLWDGEQRIFKISSDRVTIDRRTGDLVFIGHVFLDAAENGNIISHRIRWMRKTSLFRIKDHFILTRGNEKKEGSELETDYLLKQIKYRFES